MNTRASVSVLFLALVLTVAAGACRAQPAARYPERPVRLVVPFAPGGTNDVIGRFAAFIRSEIAKWAKVIRAAGIKPE